MNNWMLYALNQPMEDGIYEVRLNKKDSLLDTPVETLMEYKNGEWLMRVPTFINEYYVSAWRHRG